MECGGGHMLLWWRRSVKGFSTISSLIEQVVAPSRYVASDLRFELTHFGIESKFQESIDFKLNSK